MGAYAVQEQAKRNNKAAAVQADTTVEKKTGIIIVGQVFYPEFIANGQGLTELAEVLVNMNVDITAVCGYPTIIGRKSGIPARIDYKGIRINRVRGTRLPKLNLFCKILNQGTYSVSVFFHLLFNSSKKPILVDTTPAYLPFFCALLRILKKKPYLVRISDVYPDTAVNAGLFRENGIVARIWDRVNEVGFKYSSDIVVLGRCMRDLINRRTKGKFKDKIHVIHLWSDDQYIRPLPREENRFRKEWKLDGKFVVGYSGNMGRSHDMETIMEAAKALSCYVDIVFLFTGEGYKKSWIMEFAKRQKLANCQFHSYVDKKDLRHLLTCADVGLVSLSPGQEGLSVPSKTYGIMAAGVPVIAIMSSASEIARVIKEEECGIVVKPGDIQGLTEGILKLFHNSDELEIMNKKARQAIDAKYNLQSAARTFYKFICCLNTE